MLIKIINLKMECVLMEDGFKEYLKKEGVSNPENPTKSDIKKY